MRSVTLYIIFSFLCLCVNAQDNSNKLNGREMELATYIPTSTPIKGMQYTFSENVHSYYVDDTAREIIILLKKEKEIKIGAVCHLIVFDMVKKTIKWEANLNGFNVFITRKHVISTNDNNIHCYNRANGKQEWKKSDAKAKYVDQWKGIILTDHIRALDMNTGKTIWQKYMPAKCNWDDLLKVSDSSVVIVAGGVYQLNMYTGKGWSTNDITGKDEFTIPSAMGTIPPAATFPEISVPEIKNKPDVWRSTTSGLVANGNSLYIATNKRLLSLNVSDGKLNWSADLPKDQTGISSFYFSHDNILLVNEGRVSNSSNINKKYGQPYLASFNKENGTKNYIKMIEGQQNVRKVVTSYMADTVIVVLNNSIHQYEAENGRTIDVFNATDSVHFESMIDAKNLFKTSGKNSSKEPGLHFYGGNGAIYFYGISSHKLQSLEPTDLAVAYPQLNYNILYNIKNNVIKENKSIVLTPETNKGFVTDDVLYILNKNTLSVIPLAEPAQ